MTDIGPALPHDTEPPKKKWKRHFERGTPKEALTWKSAKQRSARMFAWQCAVMKSDIGSKSRPVRVAWLLAVLSLKEGYAYPADSYIASETGLQLNHVQAALAELERAGAIVRASSFVDGKPQRRIWPSTKIIPPKTGGIHTPQFGSRDTPQNGGTDSIRKEPTSKPRLSTTADAARRDAERRERAALKRLGAATGLPGEDEGPGANPRSIPGHAIAGLSSPKE